MKKETIEEQAEDNHIEQSDAVTIAMQQHVKHLLDIGKDVPPHLQQYIENPPPPPPAKEPEKPREKVRETPVVVEHAKPRETAEEIKARLSERDAKLAEKREVAKQAKADKRKAAVDAKREAAGEAPVDSETNPPRAYFPMPEAMWDDPVITSLSPPEYRLLSFLLTKAWRSRKRHHAHYFGAVRRKGLGPFTQREIAEVLSITERSLRKHIGKLLSFGLIENCSINGAKYLRIVDFESWYEGTRYAESYRKESSEARKESSEVRKESSKTDSANVEETFQNGENDEIEQAPEAVDFVAEESPV